MDHAAALAQGQTSQLASQDNRSASGAYGPANAAAGRLAPSHAEGTRHSSTQQRNQAAGACPRPNVGNGERIASTLIGGALLLGGISRGGLRGLLLGLGGGALIKRGATGHCQLYQAMGMDTAQSNEATVIPAKHGVKVEKSFTINRTPEELFDYWSKLENLPRIMRHLESVESLGGNRTRWIAKGPLNINVQWEAETIVQSRPDVISWRSLPGSQVDTAGSVHFKSMGKDRGTMLKVSLKYDPPGGKVGAAIAGLFGQDAEQQLDDDLRRFKSMMEAGEVPTIQGQPRGQ